MLLESRPNAATVRAVVVRDDDRQMIEGGLPPGVASFDFLASGADSVGPRTLAGARKLSAVLAADGGGEQGRPQRGAVPGVHGHEMGVDDVAVGGEKARMTRLEGEQLVSR